MRRVGVAARAVVLFSFLLLAGPSIAETQDQPATANAAATQPAPAEAEPQSAEGKKSVDPEQAERADRGIALGLGLAVLLVLLAVIDHRFPILRDRPRPGADMTGKKLPYSLGRVQMAFWTGIVAVSAVVLYFLGKPSGGEIVLINGTAAILIGISGSAGLVSDFVDSTKDSQFVENGGEAKIAADSKPFARTTVTGGFFTDILEDDNGNSLHRIQMVIFTLILGAVFCWEVIKGEMPEFSEATLGLMGISGGTYVGFKLPGKST